MKISTESEVNMGFIILTLVALVILVILFFLSGIKIVNQYERGVVLTLGRYSGICEPGLRIIVPVFQQIMTVDVRSMPVDVPKQEIITKDNVTVKIDAVVYLRVVDARKAVLESTNYVYATSQFAKAALRDVAGNAELDQLFSNREEISQHMKNIVDSETAVWGIDVENVKIQDIELPQDMKRAMARQAEAERERRAAIITAEGEKASAHAVADAARVLSGVPGGISIRTLQTLEKISVEPSQKTVIVVPSELTNLFTQK